MSMKNITLQYKYMREIKNMGIKYKYSIENRGLQMSII
jgi:hypothetical protein